MKKALFVGPILLLAILLSLNTVFAQMGSGMMGGGYGMGHHMMGPRMMGPGYGPGTGMMGRGYGRGPGMMGQGGYAEGYCPNCGSSAGPGMMGGGYGMGHHMMGRDYGMGPGRMGQGGMMSPGKMGPGQGMGPGYGYGSQYQQSQKALEEKDVTKILENYLKNTRNPNLKLGKIVDKESAFEADILTKDESLVDKIAVDKNTGWMRSIY